MSKSDALDEVLKFPRGGNHVMERTLEIHAKADGPVELVVCAEIGRRDSYKIDRLAARGLFERLAKYLKA